MTSSDDAISVNQVAIRLTDERWRHILDRHPEMQAARFDILEAVRNPDLMQRGDDGTKIAVRFCEGTPVSDKHMVVVYRENGDDGFVVTARRSRPNGGRRYGSDEASRDRHGAGLVL